jgi:PadR family transcriptional regulator, regulatory protein PadR
MSRDALGYFELLVLLAVLRLEDAAYGAPIAQEIESATSREVIVGSVYAALERLQEKGMVTSRLGESTPERGGRAKRFFRLTAKGLREVRASRNALTTLWAGIPRLAGGLA